MEMGADSRHSPDPGGIVSPEGGEPQGGADASALTQEELAFLKQELGADLEFLGALGRGRAANVYLAKQKGLDRLVAVKVLSRDLSDDPVAKARFEREAKAAASFDHPNAVTVYRSGILSNHVPYQIMQYVKGRTLEEQIAAEGPLPEEEARRVLAEVADALAAAHKRGFVHRDLRPGNVLCDEEACRVLVSDFGLAGILPHARGTDPRLTRIGEVLSTPRYSSPELLKGEDPTEGTDVYALGVLGYEILTGEGPFAGRSDREIAMAHLKAPPRTLTSLRPGVMPALADLLERCLAKDPRKRPPAAFLAKAIRELSAPAAPTSGADSKSTGVVEALLQKRFPQVVVVTAGAGWFLQEFIGNQVDMGLLAPRWYGLTWATVACAVGASGIVAWFHGEKGKQRVTPLEILLLSLVALIWVAAGVFILF